MRSSRTGLTMALVLAFAAPVSALNGVVERAAGVRPAVTDVAYEITFDAALASASTVLIEMSFGVSEAEDVVLSLPAWTPGAYRIGNFARNVSKFDALVNGEPIPWDKLDHDSWRVRAPGEGRVSVSFEFLADSLDVAMAWTGPDFLFVNGTNIFLYPETDQDFAATVRVRTEPGWRVATGMGAGPEPGTWEESSYHDLVDMPLFIGRFDLDSVSIDGRMNRLATYPAGAMSGAVRETFWTQLERMTPVEASVFGETPWQTYTTMIVFSDDYPGASALEHQNSHLAVYNSGMVGNLTLPLVTAHEQFHAWNVKRLRPTGMVPYRYDRVQPTPWLWVAEGVTDYYADLTLVRSGVAPEPAFYAITSGKIAAVLQLPNVALEDASLSTWIQPRDGTGYVYYDKGSLAGLLLDILIRDASDNRASLDDVMRELYASTWRQGRGFTGEDWWAAVSRAAGGRSFDEFNASYIDGRKPLPWGSVLPLAAMKFVADTVREPRIGVQLAIEPDGVHVVSVITGSMAAEAGIQSGDRFVSIGGIEVVDLEFGASYRQRFAGEAEGTPVSIVVDRNGRTVTLEGGLRFWTRIDGRIEPDPAATGKAIRIREGILKGRTDRS